jgi:hypothetical protein
MPERANRALFTIVFATVFLAFAVTFMSASSLACGAKTNTTSVQKASVDGQETAPVQTANVTVNSSNCTKGSASTTTVTATGCPTAGANVQQATAQAGCGNSSTATSITATGTASPCGASPANVQRANASSCGKAAATAQILKADATSTTQGCTKEECIAKLVADGMTQSAAEAKYATCLAGGKCGGSSATAATMLAESLDKSASTAPASSSGDNQTQ